MKLLHPLMFLCILLLSQSLHAQAQQGEPYIVNTAQSPYAKLKSIKITDVQWTPGFWSQWFDIASKNSLPFLYELMADSAYAHAVDNLKIAAGLEEGDYVGTDWQDAWVYKWIEMAAVAYALKQDPTLEKKMDALIDLIAKAQQEDGYIASQNQVRNRPRFESNKHHEWYVMGHLLTAACIHYRMTGKDNFLKIAQKVGDFSYTMFSQYDQEIAHFPMNPSLVMGAVELYRVTQDKKYLELANLVIDLRGKYKGGSDLNQDRVPLRQEKEVVGHAVFYTYLYAGAADAYMETGDTTLLHTLDRLWEDLTAHKMFITGGVSALHKGLSIREGNIWGADAVHEAVGMDYELPNASSYNETCGQVGNFMWNYRMLQITGEAKYADIMEKEMYNGFLSGISLDGKAFWYANPLRWYGDEQYLLNNNTQLRHKPGIDKRICCPTNVVRSLIEMQSYFYSTAENELWVHQYGGNVFDNGTVRLRQETEYPWEGLVKITIDKIPDNYTLRLRIPVWAAATTLKVNGEKLKNTVQAGTYAALKRAWKKGDVITVEMPMQVDLMAGNFKIEATLNQVAVMRGPIVYCLESPDLPKNVRLEEVVLPLDTRFTTHHEPALLKGVTVLEGQGTYKAETATDSLLYHPVKQVKLKPFTLKLIPYYAWANRGITKMSVWIPVDF